MAATTSQRLSGHGPTSFLGPRSAQHGRKPSNEPKKEIWSSMLESVSSGKRLPVKNLLVLGGTPETQKDLIESLSTDPASRRRPPDRSRARQPPIANQFALGYTYQDVLDADQEDTLARLSIHLLPDASPTMTPLLAPLLNPQTIPNLLLVILLDWSQPWLWIRQLRSCIRMLRFLLTNLDDESKDLLESNIRTQQERGRSPAYESAAGAAASTSAEANVVIPLGPGELDEPLGIPICVVCQNANKIETLEKERGWKDNEFDFILQYLRTILLKHGASLVYTMPSMPGEMRALVHSHLGISSTLSGTKKLTHNIVDRDRVLVPPGWDSWGKIRVLQEAFDIEGVSRAWGVDIQVPPGFAQPSDGAESDGRTDGVTQPDATTADEPQGSAVAMYEETIRPGASSSTFSSALHPNKSNGIEVEILDTQKFLAGQLEVLERLEAEEKREKANTEAQKPKSTFTTHNDARSGIIEEHIGPVQFNMGGIQVDADDMDREANRTAESDAPSHTSPVTVTAAAEGKSENEMLASFFAGLIKKDGDSAASSPRRGTSRE